MRSAMSRLFTLVPPAPLLVRNQPAYRYVGLAGNGWGFESIAAPLARRATVRARRIGSGVRALRTA